MSNKSSHRQLPLHCAQRQLHATSEHDETDALEDFLQQLRVDERRETSRTALPDLSPPEPRTTRRPILPIRLIGAAVAALRFGGRA